MVQVVELTLDAAARVAGGGYDISFDPSPNRVRAVFGGETIADSSRAMIMRETRLDPVYYFPREDVRMDLMRRTSHRTHCPFRGNASYWTMTVGEATAENVMWSYEDPYEEAADVKEYVAFYRDRMEAWYVGEREIGDEDEDLSRVHPNPLVEWLLKEAWDTASSRVLVGQLGRRLVAVGIPAWRIQISIQTLHPQVFATGYTWWRGTDEIEVNQAAHSQRSSPEYLESPIAPIFEGAGGVRRRLDGANPTLDFPVLKELQSKGGTDYVAMPMPFSDGQINAVSLTSDRPGGFTTDNLGHIYEILPLLSRLFEVHATRRTAGTLLETYLGKHTGKRVLDGQIKRGDGETLHAVIWFCDLRDSTPLADSIPRHEFLAVLNRFFECMAGAVVDHEGEVLRFVGDAVLAIFPIAEASAAAAAATACGNALEAARDASARMEALNRERKGRGESPLAFGIGLHLGDVLYGNIGIPERLEFTVIGAAANQAARIEELTKTVGRPVLVSSDFARHYAGKLDSVGRHPLRGVSTDQEFFAIPEPAAVNDT